MSCIYNRYLKENQIESYFNPYIHIKSMVYMAAILCAFSTHMIYGTSMYAIINFNNFFFIFHLNVAIFPSNYGNESKIYEV